MTPDHPPTAPQLPDRVPDDRPCLTCGYNLRGLLTAEVCPECATPVANSLRGDLLRYSSPEYVAHLHRGVFLIQTSIVGHFISIFVFPIVFGAATAAGVSGPNRVVASGPWLFGGLSTLVGIVSVIGWWLFSARDPALGDRDEGATARVVVRVTVMIQAAATAVSMAFRPGAGGPAQGPGGVIDILGSLLIIGSVLATVVWWFAAMLYVRQIAPRIPSERVLRRSRLLIWLVPVLMVVVCLGWLINLILYYNLLEWIRKDLKAVRAEQARAAGA